METASNNLTVLPTSRAQVFAFADRLKHEIIEGQINPLELERARKAIEDVFTILADTLRPAARAEAEKYGQKSFETMGMKIELAENGTKYDYSQCGDPVRERLAQALESAKGKLKDRETFLKGIKEPMPAIDPETDEAIVLNPPVKTSTSGLKITLV